MFHQNRNLPVNCICRIAPTAITRPYVGEFTIVSIVVNCGVLKIFVADARSSTTRDSFNGITLVSAMLNTRVPGPVMLLRRALPNCAGGGAINAAVLNHCATVGSEMPTGNPVTSGRSVPLVPRLTSLNAPRILGVKGSPEAIVQSPLHCQSPKTARHGLAPESHCLSCPNGSSHK